MRTIEDWLAEYNESHRNPVNKTLHWICVPLIVLSLLGFLWPIELTLESPIFPLTLRGSHVLVVLALVYYAVLSLPLAAGMLLLTTVMLYLLHFLSAMDTSLWSLCLLVFVLAWAGQFIGHQVEGKKPSFFKDIQFLLIGPLWLLSFVYRKLGIPY